MAKKQQSALSGFNDFIREQGVIGLAVGFILGKAVSDFVASIVMQLINPLLGWVLGGVNLAAQTVTLAEATATKEAVVLGWGTVVEMFINFVVIAAVVYFGVKGLGLDKMDKSKDD